MGYSQVLYCFYDSIQLNKRQICHHIETNIENNKKSVDWFLYDGNFSIDQKY